METNEVAQIAEQVATLLAAKTAGVTTPQPGMTIPVAPVTAPTTVPGMMPAGAMSYTAPTPTGVSLGCTLILPDGREVPSYLHFGPELLNNPHLLAQIAAAWPVKAYWPRQGGWNGGGGYGRRRY